MESIKVEPNTKATLGAYNLFQRWDRLSWAQRSLALTNIGINSITDEKGKPLSQFEVLGSEGPGYRPVTVGGLLSAAQKGYNMYELARNWGDLNTVQKVVGGARTAVGLAQLGVDNGLLSSTGDIATRYIPLANMATSAFNVARNWNKMNTEGRAVSTVGLASAGANAAATMGSELAASWVPVLNIAMGAYTAVQLSEAGRKAYGDKYGPLSRLPIMGAIATLKSMSGKDKNQKIRDWYRSDWQKRGIADEEYKITLADGSIADIGLDGRGGMHTAKDKSKLVGKDTGEYRAYQTDYTNDMDFTAGMAGVTLNRLIYGGRSGEGDSMGSQLGNALLGSVGHGSEMTEQNFNTVMANARGLYAKAGIKSKKDMLDLIAQAAKEGRLTALDQISAQQTANMIYDEDGYSTTASPLMQGRWAGINNLKDEPARPDTIEAAPVEAVEKPEVAVGETVINRFNTKRNMLSTKEDVRARNAAKFSTAMVA